MHFSGVFQGLYRWKKCARLQVKRFQLSRFWYCEFISETVWSHRFSHQGAYQCGTEVRGVWFAWGLIHYQLLFGLSRRGRGERDDERKLHFATKAPGEKYICKTSKQRKKNNLFVSTLVQSLCVWSCEWDKEGQGISHFIRRTRELEKTSVIWV